MGIYSKYIFPRLMNRSMAVKTLTPYRAELLQHARGKVLELGFGTGLNLPYYPAHIHELHAVDVNEAMRVLARKKPGPVSHSGGLPRAECRTNAI